MDVYVHRLRAHYRQHDLRVVVRPARNLKSSGARGAPVVGPAVSCVTPIRATRGISAYTSVGFQSLSATSSGGAGRAAYPSAVGAAVGVATVVLAAGLGGYGLFTHEICVVGQAVAKGTFWTPYELVNIPYGGSTVYSSRFTIYDVFGTTVVTVNNATLSGANLSSGYFETELWSLHPEENGTAAGPGVNSRCGARFFVNASAPGFDVGVDAWLQGPGNTSNVNEPTTFDDNDSASPYPLPPASFSNGFIASNLPNISTCGRGASEQNMSSDSLQVGLTLATAGGPLAVAVTIHSTERFTYHFPSNGGIWLEDDLEANPGLKGPGIAFEWLPCP